MFPPVVFHLPLLAAAIPDPLLCPRATAFGVCDVERPFADDNRRPILGIEERLVHQVTHDDDDRHHTRCDELSVAFTHCRLLFRTVNAVQPRESVRRHPAVVHTVPHVLSMPRAIVEATAARAPKTLPPCL